MCAVYIWEFSTATDIFDRLKKRSVNLSLEDGELSALIDAIYEENNHPRVGSSVRGLFKRLDRWNGDNAQHTPMIM